MPLQRIEPDKLAIARLAVVPLHTQVQQLVPLAVVRPCKRLVAPLKRARVRLLVAVRALVPAEVVPPRERLAAELADELGLGALLAAPLGGLDRRGRRL